jgi:hypothetical protein
MLVDGCGGAHACRVMTGHRPLHGAPMCEECKKKNKQVPEGPPDLIRSLRREGAMWILLLLPFVGLLWVPFYNFAEPSLFGFPFFYWYQLAWVPITSLLIWLVYRSRTSDDETR